MRAFLYFGQKSTDEESNLIEVVIWKVPINFQQPQGIRYRLAFIPKGHKNPAVLYDNHHPKGHHKHIDGKQLPYIFSSIHQLRLDFEKDMETWVKARR